MCEVGHSGSSGSARVCRIREERVLKQILCKVSLVTVFSGVRHIGEMKCNG